MKRITVAVAVAALSFVFLPYFGHLSYSQSNAVASSQALVEVDGTGQLPGIGDVTLSVDGKKQPLLGWSPVTPAGVQIAVLIDDGLTSGVNQELAALRSFTKELPAGVQIFIGYLSNGSIIQAQGFTTDHAAAAQRVRAVRSASSQSASPYLYISAFARQWPADRAHPAARFILMLSSGNDPYLGQSVGNNNDTTIVAGRNSQVISSNHGREAPVENRNDNYVKSAIEDANAAGVSVSSVYYLDAGANNDRLASLGRGLLANLSDGTGGHAFQQPNRITASLAPYLAEFQESVLHTYIATFPVKENAKGLLAFKADTKAAGMKLRVATQVSAHNVEMTPPAK